MIHHIGEKCPIVADQKNRFVGICEVVLQPACRFEIEMVRRLVEQKHVGRAYQLSRQTESSALPAAQLSERLRARLLRIESKSLQHGVDTRRERVAAFAIESLEISIVPRQHLGDAASPTLTAVALLRERVLEREQIGELSGARFPDRFRAAEVAMLLEQSQTADRAVG